MGLSPFCFLLWSFLLLFSAEHMLQRGISACRICLFRIDLLPLMLAKMCQLCLLFLPARFLLFCAVSPRCVLHLCSTALVAVVCGLAQRSHLHCFMCLVLRCRLIHFVLVRYSYYSGSMYDNGNIHLTTTAVPPS